MDAERAKPTPLDLGDKAKPIASAGSDASKTYAALAGPQLPNLSAATAAWTQQAKDSVAALEQYKKDVMESIAGMPKLFAGMKQGLVKMAQSDPFNSKGLMAKAQGLAEGMTSTFEGVKAAIVQGVFNAMEGVGVAIGKGANGPGRG